MEAVSTHLRHDQVGTILSSGTYPSPGLSQAPLMSQWWEDLAFLHWPYDPAIVQGLLPEGLVLDTHEDAAWVGLIPFTMKDIRFRRGPAVPILGTFPEVNVRTYVVGPNGDRAVWFFSLDVPRLIPSLVAKTVFDLPYHWGAGKARKSGDMHHWSVRRRSPGRVSSEIAVEFGEPLARSQLTSLERFLTDRRSLVTCTRGRLRHAQIHHPQWQLRRGQVVHLADQLVEAAGLPTPEGQPTVLTSDGVPVWATRSSSFS